MTQLSELTRAITHIIPNQVKITELEQENLKLKQELKKHKERSHYLLWAIQSAKEKENLFNALIKLKDKMRVLRKYRTGFDKDDFILGISRALRDYEKEIELLEST